MLKIESIARIGRDAQVNIVNGKSVINFSAAHTEKFKNSDGTEQSKVTWLYCAWWTEKTKIADYLKKGTTIYVEGKPDTKIYQNEEKINQAQLHIRVSYVTLVNEPKQQ